MYEELIHSLREKAEFLTVSDVQKAPPGLSIKNLFAETMSEAADAIEAMRELIASYENRQRWIPVTDADNLPKESTPCLVASNQWGGEKVRKATYLVSEKIFLEGAFDITEYVTHWMPSPEPPKEDGDE